MAKSLRSVGTSVFLGAAILVFSVEVLAPRLPPYVGPPDYRETRSLSFPAEGSLRLVNTDGAVRIVISQQDSAREIGIEVEITVYALNQNADRRMIERYVDSLLEIRSADGRLSITTEPSPRPPALALRAEYTLSVPPGTDIDIRGTNGNIWIAEGCGEVSVHSQNSDIEILRPMGPVVAQSINGRIRLRDAQDRATLETVNGNIRADVRKGTLHASSTNGSIRAYVLGQGVEGCVVNSDNGGIEVFLPDNVSFTVNASAPRGSIRSDFLIEGAGASRRTNELSGSIGDGETKLNLTTGNGSIWLIRGRA